MKQIPLCCLLCLTGLCCAPETHNERSAAPFTLPEGSFVDLTYSFDTETIYWPTADGFSLNRQAQGWQESGYYYEANTFTSAEHGGTHLDAPIHFSEGKWTADAIPLERLIGPAVAIDVRAKTQKNRDYLITIEDITQWEKEHGTLEKGSIVLLHTGYGQFWPDRERYMGTARRGMEAIPELHFPGLSPAAAEWLVTERSIHAIGIDTPSIDYGQSQRFESHQNLFKANIPAFENVANMDRLPTKGAIVIALPMKIAGGSGGPLRIIALIPND